MCFVPTTLTIKSRSHTVARQSALIANLARISRIDKGYCQAIPLRSIRNALNQQVIAKAVQFTTRSFTHRLLFGPFFNLKVFKHKYSVFRNPLAKLCRRFSTKCFSFITLFPRQTFQDTTHRSAVFAQFLFRRFFTLNSSSGFSNAFPVFFKPIARDNDGLSSCRSHEHIFNPNVDSYRDKTFWFRNIECNTEHPLSVWTNAQRISGYRIFKIRQKSIRNSKSKFLPTCDGPDRQLSIFRQRCIASFFSNQEQRLLSTEDKWTFSWTFIGLCRRVSSSHNSNSSAPHLSVKGRFDLVIHCLMQTQSASWRMIVKSLFGNSLLISIKFLNRIMKIFRSLKNDWYASLYQHAIKITLKKINNKWRPRFLPYLKEGVPARAF